MSISTSTKNKPRLNKAQWLARAMELLEQQGPGAMRLDNLTRHLSVTTGSFYHHFGNHGRFLEELTDKYIEDFTYVVRDHLATLDLPARDMLIEAMRQIVSMGLGGMDVHFRSLAIGKPAIADKIQAMDEMRSGIIRKLFRGMGYRGPELRMRVHNFVVLNSLEHGVHTGLTVKARMRLFDERVKLLID